jgi:uncharacterized repeat protein (TIGR01451 family)
VRDGAGNEAQARAVTRLGQPDLPLLTKSASYEVYPGSPIVYTITLRNPGGATLYDVVVTDPVPEYVLYPTGVTGGGQVENNTTVVWRLPQLSAGETITLSWQGQVATDIPPRQSEIINDVTLEAAGGLRVTAQARSFVRQPRLALNKWATLEAGPGDPVTYTLTVENWGQAPAYDLVIADPIPEYIEGATSISGEVRADEVRLTIATLPAGETATLTWQGQVATDLPGTVSEIVNEATVRDSAGNEAGARAVTRLGQPDPPLLTKAATYEVYPGGPVVYTITLRNPGGATLEAGPGELVEYTIQVANLGDAPAHEVVVTDPPSRWPTWGTYEVEVTDGTWSGSAVPARRCGLTRSSGALRLCRPARLKR